MAVNRNKVRHFEFVRGNSRKFWEIRQKGSELITCWGKLGSVGRIAVKSCESALQANLEYAKLVASKLAKGYTEGSGIPF